MIEPQLTLRPTVIGGDRLGDDYGVYSDDRRIGRIRLATERPGHNSAWDWHINPPLPIPSWGNDSEPDLERAKTAFRETWTRFYGSLTPDDIAHWHATADARA
jgi:hypothetical protein